MSPEARERSFDELASALASGNISRRRALKLMGAALVGGTLASLGIREAAADPPGCKRAGKRCKRDTQCCSGNCSSSGTCAAACVSNGVSCTSDSQCCSGNCDDVFGVCLPPIGPNRQTCLCKDDTLIERCTSTDCSTEQQLSICNPLCESHGGVNVRGCSPGACL
jgi:hypothetical protein